MAEARARWGGQRRLEVEPPSEVVAARSHRRGNDKAAGREHLETPRRRVLAVTMAVAAARSFGTARRTSAPGCQSTLRLRLAQARATVVVLGSLEAGVGANTRAAHRF